MLEIGWDIGRRGGTVRSLTGLLVVVGCLQVAGPARADDPDPGSVVSIGALKLGFELKLGVRDTHAFEFQLAANVPPSFLEPGEDHIYLRQPQAGTSAEIENVALWADGDLAQGIHGHLRIHFSDLYNRNPTSSDDRIFVREAWLLFGNRYKPLKRLDGSSLYLQLGKAPRFTKQVDRHLESYGLWGTAVGRFEEMGAELGGTLGSVVYWRGSVAAGNPLFFRDSNALAGDNGTPERVPGNVHPIYQSGFPIIYDAKAQDTNLTGTWQAGGGVGLRWFAAGSRNGLDLLLWYFKRELADQVQIRGTSYLGDLHFLRFLGLPVSGRDKVEYGTNLQARLGGLEVFGQLVIQEIAKLKRDGYEVELVYRVPLPGLFAAGDSPVVNWIAPVVRYSSITNRFSLPRDSVAPTLAWDWNKLDLGVRVGIVRGLDATFEFARHDMILRSGKKLHPDEMLTTVRIAF
jgi:hypothetical protein